MALPGTGTSKLNLKEWGCPRRPGAVCLCVLRVGAHIIAQQVESTIVEFKHLRNLALLGNHKMFEQRNKNENTLGMGKMSQERL